MEKLIKENIIWLLLPILVFGGLAYGLYNFGTQAKSSMDQKSDLEQQVQTNKEKLEKIRQEKANNENQPKKVSKSGKVIYEVLGQQFSPEASFGIMFENLLSNMTNSGVRIRSIEYNYHPNDDRILSTNAAGYNACELSFTTVSTYSQLQSFFKNLTKENYLTNIYEVYIEPFDRDKTILIAKFKIRLYTKLI